jgi:hypothetical protein
MVILMAVARRPVVWCVVLSGEARREEELPVRHALSREGNRL